MRVLVVGGGVAGSLYALLETVKGVEVEVVDVSRHYARPCGEAVPSPELVERAFPRQKWMAEAWSHIFNMYVKSYVVDRLRKVLLAYATLDEGVVLYRVDNPGYTVGYIVDKKVMVEAWRGRAEAEGARFRVVGGWVEPGRAAASYGRVVYACAGCARRLGRKYRMKALVARFYCERSRLLEEYGVDGAIVFVRGLHGYVWAWRAGGRINAGIGALEGTATPDELLAYFRIVHGMDGCGRPGWSRIYWFHPHNPAEPLWEGVYVLGEAAGLVTALAEGMRPAMLSAYALHTGDEWFGRKLAELAGRGRATARNLGIMLSMERFARTLINNARLEYAVNPPTIKDILAGRLPGRG